MGMIVVVMNQVHRGESLRSCLLR